MCLSDPGHLLGLLRAQLAAEVESPGPCFLPQAQIAGALSGLVPVVLGRAPDSFIVLYSVTTCAWGKTKAIFEQNASDSIIGQRCQTRLIGDRDGLFQSFSYLMARMRPEGLPGVLVLVRAAQCKQMSENSSRMACKGCQVPGSLMGRES